MEEQKMETKEKVIDYEMLYEKYNAHTTDTTKSNYNDINGANCHSELLRDSRKFKAFISKVLKTEFNDLKFKIFCSFAGYKSHCDIELYLDDPFMDYKEAEAKGGLYNLITTTFYDWNNPTQAQKKYLYNNYFKVVGIKQTRWSYANYDLINYLKDDARKLYDFIEALLNSYSYDHSDIMTDYFSSGLDGNISVFDARYSEEERKGAFDKVSSASKDEIETEGAETEEEKNYLKAKHEEEERKTLEYFENIKKQQFEEAEKRVKKQEKINKLLADDDNIEITDLQENEMILEGARFSSWNKPENYNEAVEYVEKYNECPNVGTVAFIKRIINFKNLNLFNEFKDSTLSDHWAKLNNNIGGCGHLKKVNNEYIDTSREESREIYYSKLSDLQLAKLGYHWGRICILIQFNGVNQFLVDPEGFNYCRYIGLLPPENYKPIEESNNELILNKSEQEIYDQCLRLGGNSEFSILDFGAKRNYSKRLMDALAKINIKIDFTKSSINFKKVNCMA